MRGFFSGAFGLVMVVAVFGFAIFTLGAGWAGIEDAFGWGWGVAAIVLALMFRFTLPISVGVFLFARDTWEWHWVFALLLAAPGLIFMIPGLIAAAFSAIRKN